MIKKHSILLLSTLFILQTTHPMHPGNPGIPPVGGSSSTSADGKKSHEEKLRAENGTQISNATALITVPQTPVTSPTPPAPAAPNTAASNAKAEEKQKKELTLEDLNGRASRYSIGFRKSVWRTGVDQIILESVEKLNSGEKINHGEPATQSQLGRAIADIVASNNKDYARRFITAVSRSTIVLEGTSRDGLRKFIDTLRTEAQRNREEEYAQAIIRVKEIAAIARQEVEDYNQLEDLTKELSGELNYTSKELAFIQGDKAQLTNLEQAVLAQKILDRKQAGISDNEFEQPTVKEPHTLSDPLFTVKMSEKSVKNKRTKS